MTYRVRRRKGSLAPPGPHPALSDYFGEEFIRFGANEGWNRGWRIIGALEETAMDLETRIYRLINEKRPKWLAHRPPAIYADPLIRDPKFSLGCFLIGPTQALALPHVFVFTAEEWLATQLVAIILDSKILRDYALWKCRHLHPSLTDTKRQLSNLLDSAFFSHSPLTQTQKEMYLDSSWPRPPSGDQTAVDDSVNFDSYFEFLKQERNPAVAEDHAFAKFDDFFFILSVLKGYWTQSLEQVIDVIQTERPGLAIKPSKLVHSIELVVRLWLLMDIRNRMPSNPYQLQTSIPWHDSSSLSSVLETYITSHQHSWDGVIAKFPGYFNLYDMKRIGGTKVEWTNNLTLHLTMKGPVLYIFHGVSILRRIRESASTSPSHKPDFLEETLATISLLIPSTNTSCNNWLAKEVKRLNLDQNIIHRNSPIVDKSRYPYWQDKLLAIEDAFEKSKPRNLAQWWHDRRDMQRWWGFWLAITSIFLTLFFGLFQSVTGIIQVVKPS